MSSERSYLDGVPLRLSSKFCPIPRVHFKEIDIHIPIDALQEDYDFSLERCAIAEAKAWEDAQILRAEKESQEQLEQEKEEIERLVDSKLKLELDISEKVNSDNFVELSSTDVANDSNRQVTNNTNPQETLTTPTSTYPVQTTVSSSHSSESVVTEDDVPKNTETLQNFQTSGFGSSNAATSVPLVHMQTYRQDVAGAILQPLPHGLNNDYELSSNYGRVNTKGSDRSYYSHIPISKINLNLSDFESDTANPFDNVELKSINDMEVLATVLKNNSLTAATSTQQNQDSSRTVNMNYMNGVGSVGFSSEQTQLMYYPSSSYPNQNFPNPNQWTPSQYFNPNVPTTISSPSVVIPPQTNSSSLETPVITQSQLPNTPISVNSFTRFYFPLLTSMANSRASRDRNNSHFGVLPVSQDFGNGVGPVNGLNPAISVASPIANQNPNTTSTHSMYPPSNILQRHNIASQSQSPSQSYWGNGGNQHLTGSNQYVTSNRFTAPHSHHNEATSSPVNATPNFENAGLSTSPIPKGSHSTLH